MVSLTLFLKTLAIVHAAAGTVALLAGPVAMLTQKGGSRHRRAGRYYTISMVVVFITAVVLAYLKSLAFLFMVAFFSFYLVLSGYRALAWKGLAKQGRVPLMDWIIQLGAGLTAAVLLAWGGWQVFNGGTFGAVAIIFGAIALARVWQTVTRFRTPPEEAAHWLYAHIVGMSAGYIATLTAFLVVNIKFLPAIVVWLLPTVVGVPIILSVIRRHRQQRDKRTAVVLHLPTNDPYPVE